MENESQRFTWKNLLGGVFGFSIGYALWHFTGSFALGVFFGLFFGIIGLFRGFSGVFGGVFGFSIGYALWHFTGSFALGFFFGFFFGIIGLFRGFGGVVGLILGFSCFILLVILIKIWANTCGAIADILGDATIPIVVAINFVIGGALYGFKSTGKKRVLYLSFTGAIVFVIWSVVLRIIGDDIGGIIGLTIWGIIGGGSLGLIFAYLTKDKYASKEDKLVSAAHDGDLYRIKELIDEGVDVNVKDGVGSTLLLVIAGRYGHIEIVKELIAHGADVNTKNEDGGTASSIATKRARNALARILSETKKK